jgi:hypothetical protein
MLSPLQAALAETWSLFALGTIFVALRVFARTRMVGVAGYHPDDYMIFFAWVSRFAQNQEVELTLSDLLCWNDSSGAHCRRYR